MATVSAVPSPWWNNTGYTLISNEKASLLFRVRRELKRRGFINERATLPILVGNAVGAGGAINASYNRLQYGNTSALMPGGVQPIETVVVHTGVSTAADAATLISMATFNTQPTYVKNADGNPRGNNGG